MPIKLRCAFVFVTVVTLNIIGTDGLYENPDDIFERYSKMKLLTTCLGQETMARWRQQMVTAAKSCEKEQPFIAALLHQLPTVVQRQHGGQYFVPSTPFNPAYKPHHGHQHPSPPPNPKPQTFQSIAQGQQTYYVTSPHAHQKYYYITSPQTAYQPLRFVSYPQTASYSQSKPVVVQYQPQPNSQGQPIQPSQGDQSQSTRYLANKSPPQGFQPLINTQNYQYNQQVHQPVSGFNQPQQNFVSPFVTPHVQYLAAQQQFQRQQENYQQQQAHFEMKSETNYGGEQDGSKVPARQEDTYTNPGLTLEETEIYQEEQKRLEGHKPRNEPNNPPTPSSFHQKRPLTLGKHAIGGKRIKRSIIPQASSARYPHYQHQPRPDHVRAHQLRAMQTRVNDKISNMTCIMRNMRLLTEELEPNFLFLENSLLELPISNDLHEELRQGQDYCKRASECQPRRTHLHDIPVSVEFSNSLEFFRCFGKEKLRACLKADVAAMAQLLGMEKGPITDPNSIASLFHGSSPVYPVLDELESLMNGGNGQFVDLVLL